MRWLDQTIPHHAKRNWSDNWYTGKSTGYDKDSRRDPHNNHRDTANNLTSQYQQLSHECHQHIRNIRGPIILNLKQHGGSGIPNSKNVDWWTGCIQKKRKLICG